MKFIDRKYRDLLDYSIEVGAEARVRAEWSWNNTQFLSEPARRAAKIQVIDNSGLYANVAASLGEAVNQDGNQDFFKRCFDIQENNRLNGISEYIQYDNKIIFDDNGEAVKNPAFDAPAQGPFLHYAPGWKDGENQPNFDFDKHFSVIVEFHLDIKEEGWHLFKIEADDRYELYLFDETLQAPKLVAHNYVSGEYDFNPAERNGYVAAYYETPGRYYMKALVQNVDLASAFMISKSTPRTRREKDEPTWSGNPTMQMLKIYDYTPLIISDIFYSDDNGPASNPEAVGLARIIEKNTYFDEDTKSVKFGREDVGEWNQYRQYFPTKSITEPNRPEAGINYNIPKGDVVGFIGSERDFINRPLEPRKERFYALSTNWQKYQYWVSDCKSNETEFGGEGYPIPLADLLIRYETEVPTNKVTATFSTYSMPQTYKVMASSELYGDVWDELASHETSSINPYTGKLELWRTASGLWTDEPQLDSDESIGIRRLRLVVMTMQEPGVRLGVVEFGARKHIDITESVESFSTDANMTEVEQFRVIGTSSSNSGNIVLSNLDKRFSFDHVSDIRRANLKGIATDSSALKHVVERQTKFTFDIIYKDGQEQYPMRIATMYGVDWDEADDAYKIKLHDSAKYLQNVDSPDIVFEDEPIHYVIGCILDLVGFSHYSLDMSDFKKNQLPDGTDEISTPVLKYFATDPSSSVWENLQKICEATYSAVYFDEFGFLQLITKDEITRPMQRDELTRQTIEPPAHVLRGQYHENKLPNIIEFNKNHEDEANHVVVKFKPKRIKDNGDPFAPRQLTDILWQSDRTITLQAGRITKPITKSELSEYWIDKNQEKAELWPYEGKANINGEVIAWKGKEYQWVEYVWEKYVDVLVNITNVPRLIEPWMWILRDAINFIWDGTQAIVDLLIPKEIRFLGFKTDLFGLNNWLTQLIKIDKESKMMMIHEPFYVYETIFFSKKSEERELDRVLVSQHLRTEWIYNQRQKKERDENTGRGGFGGFQRQLNMFTGRIRLVQETDENTRGRGVDESRYRAEHTELPKSGWFPKKFDPNKHKFTDGYFDSKEGSERTKVWIPILKNDFTARGDTYVTSIGVNRFNSSGLKSTQIAALMRSNNRPAKSFGFRFRFKESMPDKGDISFIFGMSKTVNTFDPRANKWPTIVPDNINDCDTYYRMTLRLTSDKHDKGKLSEVMGEIATKDSGYGKNIGSGIFGLVPNSPADDTGYRDTYFLKNLNPYEKDKVVEYRGYRHGIKKGIWYDVQIEQGDTYSNLFTVSINGKTVGTFVPPGGETFFWGGPDDRFRQILPFSKHYGIAVTPGIAAEFDYVWSWSEDTALISYNQASRYDTSKGQYISSFLETGLLVPDESQREYRDINGKLGEFFYDDFGSTVREIRDIETELDKGPGMGITYYVSNPNARMFDLATTPNKAKFSLVNLGNHMVIASGDEKIDGNKSVKNTIVVYGYKISEEQEKTIMRQNTAAIKDRGEVKEEIEADWISTDEEAVELANWVVQNFADVKDTLSLSVFPDASYSIGDRVQLIFDEKDIDPNWIYVISAIKWSVASKGIKCDLEVRRVRNNNIEYYDMFDPVYGIQKEEVRESDQRDTGELSEGGISGLTLYGPQLPNPSGEPVSGEAAESPTWKTRYPIYGAVYDMATGLFVDALGKVSALAITTAMTNFGVPPEISGVVSNFASTMVTDLLGDFILSWD